MRSVNSIFREQKELPPCHISDGCLIGAGVIIYTGCSIGNKTLVADLSTIRENVSIGEKTIIGIGTAIENFCNVGYFCKLETNVYLTAYSEVEDYVFIAPDVVTSNDNYAARSKERYNHFKGRTVKRWKNRCSSNDTARKVNRRRWICFGRYCCNKVCNKGTIVKRNPSKYYREVPDD